MFYIILYLLLHLFQFSSTKRIHLSARDDTIKCYYTNVENITDIVIFTFAKRSPIKFFDYINSNMMHSRITHLAWYNIDKGVGYNASYPQITTFTDHFLKIVLDNPLYDNFYQCIVKNSRKKTFISRIIEWENIENNEKHESGDFEMQKSTESLFTLGNINKEENLKSEGNEFSTPSHVYLTISNNTLKCHFPEANVSGIHIFTYEKPFSFGIETHIHPSLIYLAKYSKHDGVYSNPLYPQSTTLNINYFKIELNTPLYGNKCQCVIIINHNKLIESKQVDWISIETTTYPLKEKVDEDILPIENINNSNSLRIYTNYNTTHHTLLTSNSIKNVYLQIHFIIIYLIKIILN